MKRAALKTLAPVLKLSPAPAPESNYIDAVRALLLRAENGKSTGLAFVEITSDGYSVKALGEAEKSTTFCLGAIEVLKAKILKRIIG